MKFKSENELMNLPDYIKFGFEIEAQNVDFKKLKELLEQHPELKGWNLTKDDSVTDNGAELVSPPLSERDNSEVYKNVKLALELMKNCPADKNRKVYVNEQCGGHIHLDATMMRRNPEMVEAFLRLWKEGEPIIYKMCTPENDPIRRGAVKLSPIDGLKRILFSGLSEIVKAADKSEKENKNILTELPNAVTQGVKKSIHGVLLFTSSFITKNGFAHPIGQKMQKAEKKGDYIKRVLYSSKGNKFTFNKSLKHLAYHEAGINMEHFSTNRGLMGKIHEIGHSINTYEFRNHNSTLKLNELKKNLMLDTALSKIAYEMAYEPGKNDKKLSAFFEKDITEEEKADRFLDLFFEDAETRKIFKSRWESNKDAPVFQETRGFSTTFKKENLRGIAKKTNSKYILNIMKRVFSHAKEFLKDERGNNFSLDNIVMDYGGRDIEQ